LRIFVNRGSLVALRFDAEPDLYWTGPQSGSCRPTIIRRAAGIRSQCDSSLQYDLTVQGNRLYAVEQIPVLQGRLIPIFSIIDCACAAHSASVLKVDNIAVGQTVTPVWSAGGSLWICTGCSCEWRFLPSALSNFLVKRFPHHPSVVWPDDQVCEHGNANLGKNFDCKLSSLTIQSEEHEWNSMQSVHSATARPSSCYLCRCRRRLRIRFVEADPRPNIVLIMATGHGVTKRLSVNGQWKVICKSPQFWTAGACQRAFASPTVLQTPSATPSRAKIMTGQYKFRNYVQIRTLDRGQTNILHTKLKASRVRDLASLANGNWQAKDSPQGISGLSVCLWAAYPIAGGRRENGKTFDRRFVNPMIELQRQEKDFTSTANLRAAGL